MFLGLVAVIATGAMGVKMGKMGGCDDGENNWLIDVRIEGGLRKNLHCDTGEELKIRLAPNSESTSWCENEKKNLKAGQHICVEEAIHYKNHTIPVAGKHRPVWAFYGEYSYAPPQRWIHNMEHGGIVFLYHPCLRKSEQVKRLKALVSGCLRRHIITPSRRVSVERPFALVSWGCYFNFGNFQDADIITWIKTHAIQKVGVRKAPEYYVWQDGDYSHLLQKQAAIVSDLKDSKLCPSKKQDQT